MMSNSKAIAGLCLVGLAIALYLTLNYAQDQAPYCAGSGGCESVQTSEYATIVDGLTVPLLGVIGYLVLLTLTLSRGRLGAKLDLYLPWFFYGAASIGFFFSIYLTYVEAFVLHEWCYWCLGSAVVMTVIWALSIVELRRAWHRPA